MRRTEALVGWVLLWRETFALIGKGVSVLGGTARISAIPSIR
ncbi:MAG TPA: hypothetical protein VFS74_06210 [Gemmatimonadales bacterium]|nr:hypothetical protein [Gemmatimonadales bacterium]